MTNGGYTIGGPLISKRVHTCAAGVFQCTSDRDTGLETAQCFGFVEGCTSSFPALRLLLAHPSLVPSLFATEGLLSEASIYVSLSSGNSSKTRGEGHTLLSFEFLRQLHSQCATGARVYCFFEIQQQQQQQHSQQQHSKARQQLRKAVELLRESIKGPKGMPGHSEVLFDFIDLGSSQASFSSTKSPGVQLREDDAWLQGLATPYSWLLEEEHGLGLDGGGGTVPSSTAAASGGREFQLASGASVRIVSAEKENCTAQPKVPLRRTAPDQCAPYVQQGSTAVFYVALLRREPQKPNFRFKPFAS
ncbi:uncharacterized protein LOC113147555 [Cyclospora cayetanensis]|uniref:Uncharacterized protein LOC113147555 n=1 Tax=Cyclospora cayetanensis TaxID=88456 RepID=A0A6P6S2A6_9EIME|nr:uncharacterized protein LOC113147555 [Cyclospora cayetanensis]